MKSFQHIQICYYLRKLKLLPISYSETRNQSNFYIKILINYLQLSNVLIEDSQYSIFQQISFFPTTVGQPSSGIVVGIDCMISIKSFEQFGYLQYITVIQAIAPGLFLIVLIFFLRALIFMKIKGISRNLQYIIFGFIFVFFQPNQVTMLSKLFICRTIGKKSYVSEDLRLACDDRDYNIFVRVLALPLLIFWTTVPLVILRNLKKKKDSLYNFNTIYRYGFFYGEFKHQFFYWEFVRIYFKVTIVLLFTFYRYNLILSYLLGMTFLFAYNKLILILSPQKCKNLKIFEMLSILVLILNSVFSIFGIIYQSQTLDVLIQILHITFILIVIIIICYFQVNNQFNSFGKLLRAVLKFILSDRYYSKIIKGYKIEFKTYLRWKQVRQSIYLIIGRKAINNLDQIQKNSNLVSQNQTNNQNQQQRDQLLQLYQQRFHNISNHQLIKGDSTALNRPQKKSQQKQISQQQVESSEFQSFVSNPIKEDLDEKKIQIMMSPTQSFSNHNIFQLNSVKSQPNLTNEENYQFFSQQLNS